MLKQGPLTTDADRAALKQRTREALSAAGGVEFFAPVSGVKKAALSKYCGDAYTDHFIRSDVLLELDLQLGAPLLTGLLADRLGYKLVKLEPDERPSSPETTIGFQDIAELTQRHAGLMAAITTGLADGDFDHHERREAGHLLQDKIAWLSRLARRISGVPA